MVPERIDGLLQRRWEEAKNLLCFLHPLLGTVSVCTCSGSHRVCSVCMRLKGFMKRNVRSTCLHPSLCVFVAVSCCLEVGFLLPLEYDLSLLLWWKLCETQSVFCCHLLDPDRIALAVAPCCPWRTSFTCVYMTFLCHLLCGRDTLSWYCQCPAYIDSQEWVCVFQLSLLSSNKH